MCLAVPGEVIEWIEREPPFTTAVVAFGPVRRRVNLACTPAVEIGDFVLVHAGIAISQIDAAEAARILATLEEWEDSADADP